MVEHLGADYFVWRRTIRTSTVVGVVAS